MSTTDIIQLTRGELNELVYKTLNEILIQNSNLATIVEKNLQQIKPNNENLCDTDNFSTIPTNYKSSISIVNVTQFRDIIPVHTNKNIGINLLEYLNIVTKDELLKYNSGQLTIHNVANYINKITTISSKFMVLRYSLYDGIRIIFNFMRSFLTNDKYAILFKLYKTEKDGANYSQDGLLVAVVKNDNLFYYIDIDNNKVFEINLNDLSSLNFSMVYPTENFNYIDVIYTLRENFQVNRPFESVQKKPNIVNIPNKPTTTMTTFQPPQYTPFASPFTPSFTPQPFQAPQPSFTPQSFQAQQPQTPQPTQPVQQNVVKPFQPLFGTFQPNTQTQPQTQPNTQKPPLYGGFQTTTHTFTPTYNNQSQQSLFGGFQTTTQTFTPSFNTKK
jgi:hypothetical protein